MAGLGSSWGRWPRDCRAASSWAKVSALIWVSSSAAFGPGAHVARAEESTPPRESVPVESAPPESARPEPEFTHPYGLVEFGIGVLALPDAELCGGEAGCDRGDLSLEVDAWPLFRASPRFAVGAGMTLALIPFQDVPRRDTRFPREHARRYFAAEGIGRYYFLSGHDVELWSGISAGLIVVSDNFRTRSSEPEMAIIGADSANIATEGLSLGLASGVTFGVNPHLQVGATLRFAKWYLPPQREAIAFGEEASLSNRVTMLNIAFTVAYHSR